MSKLKKASLSFVEFVERLEARQLFFAAPWGVFPHLIAQDAAVANYPWLTGKGEAIAVIDKGIDYNHPSLGKGFGPGFKVEAGYDFIQNDGDPNVGQGIEPHGTGVAGILAADGYVYNGRYYQGIAPQVSLIALRQDSSQGVGKALDWVIANRVKYNIVAVNITDFIGSDFTPNIYAKQLQTLYAAGVFMGAPVGNGGPTYVIQYPAGAPEVVGTAAIDKTDKMWANDQRGTELDVLAPGDGVTTTYDDTTTWKPIYTDYAQGTSWSTPHVVATAALIKQISPNLSPAQIISIIKDSGKPYFDSVSNRTYARLDINAAIALAYKRTGITPGPPSNGPSTPFGGTPVSVSSSAPAVIEAENYDNGGEGVAYHDLDTGNTGGAYRLYEAVDVETTTDVGGGYDVGYTQTGEWMRYGVNVKTPGVYHLDARVASDGVGGTFHVEVDGKDATGPLQIPDTLDYQNWQTIGVDGVTLTGGNHTLRYVMDTSGPTSFGGNINNFTLTFQSALVPTPFGGTSTQISSSARPLSRRRIMTMGARVSPITTLSLRTWAGRGGRVKGWTWSRIRMAGRGWTWGITSRGNGWGIRLM